MNMRFAELALSACIAGLAALLPASTRAGEMTVTAEFAPSALDPSRNVFRNTTPKGVYCSWQPSFCDGNGAYTVDIPMTWTKNHQSDVDVRKRFYLALPPPRAVRLVNTTTGNPAEVKLTIATVSGQLSPGETTNPVFTQEVRGGCSYVRTFRNGAFAQFGWRVTSPDAPAPCNSQGVGGVPNPTPFNMAWIGLGLLIETDSPLSLEDGVYEGQTIYTAGGLGNDFDFGDDVTTDPIVLNFRFTVRHDFKVRFANENPRVQLAPEGGWSQWIDHGKRPGSLRQELPFHLTSSMEFSLKTRCEYDVDSRCGIRHADSDTVVPVDVDVTIPGMRNLKDGKPAQFTPVVPDDTLAPRFAPEGYVRDRRSVLRFIANREAVEKMVDKPASHWEGNMTLVFDANP